jgi:pyruvate formate lyase activating enzyme
MNEPKPAGHPAKWWKSEDGGKIRCELCPRRCLLAPGQRGFCYVRMHKDGRLVSTSYGRSTGFCVDPIEKKPLNHFLPGSTALSFGTAGCNLGCLFCQNWTSSRARRTEEAGEAASPEAIAKCAVRAGCKSVAFTYNDPVVFAEYAIDTARACRESGIRTVAVTAGYIESAPRTEFFSWMDAANVDLKAFSDEFYRKMSSGRLDRILDTLRYLRSETGVWTEITNLVIPGLNDADSEIEAMCDWILENLGPDVPLHFSAFHPDYKLRDLPATPAETVQKARRIARERGIRYAYTGNVYDPEGDTTFCPGCDRAVILRNAYEIDGYELEGSRCRFCGETIAGCFDDRPGDWGGGRKPLRV